MYMFVKQGNYLVLAVTHLPSTSYSEVIFTIAISSEPGLKIERWLRNKLSNPLFSSEYQVWSAKMGSF